MGHVPLKMPAPPQGLIATLVTGFETVNARLELILLPLALDIFLWLGPHLSIQPLVNRLQGLLVAPPGADPATLRNLTIIRDALDDYGASYNLFSALSTAPLGLPSLVAGRAPTRTPWGSPLVWQIDSALLYVLLVGALTLLGLFLAALYFGGIAQQVRDRRVRLGLLLRQVWGDWARLTALAVLALIVLVVLGLPVLVVTGVVTFFSPIAGGLLWIGGVTLILWAMFYAAFALHGMVLQRRGLWSALWDSVRLVQINLPHAAILLVLVVMVNVGLALVWNLAEDGSWYLLLGLGGHALVSTALVAATFVFYQDRYRWWIEMRETLAARGEAEKRGMKPRA